MGQRILKVSPEFLVELCKGPGMIPRTFTVGNALPADAHVAEPLHPEQASITILIESDTWDGVFELLYPPTFKIYAGTGASSLASDTL